MSTPKRSGRILYYVLSVAVLLAGGYYGMRYLRNAKSARILKTTISNLKDSLYTFSYDYFHYDEATGNAELRNVSVKPDTSLMAMIPEKLRPSVLIEAKVNSILLKGIRIKDSSGARQITGDTILINHPVVRMMGVKPFDKNILVEKEAHALYKEVLKRLNLLHVKFGLADSISILSQSYASGNPNFYLTNGRLRLEDVLIDNDNPQDSSRIFFCKAADFSVDSFVSFNNNRRELMLHRISFSGRNQSIGIDRIMLNYFRGNEDEGNLFLDAASLRFDGVNTSELLYDRNFMVDSVSCKAIKVYELPKEKVFASGEIKVQQALDTITGFRNVYAVQLKTLKLPDVAFIPLAKSALEVGKVMLTVNGVKSNRIAHLEANPLKYIDEVALNIQSMAIRPRDQFYTYGFRDLNINSAEKQLKIGAVYIQPKLSEYQFADSFPYQQDRFDVRLQGIRIDGIGMEDVFENKMIATSLSVDDVMASISRDLDKPLQQVSKVGNYPSQMLLGLELPVNVRKISLPSCDIKYSELRTRRGRVGTVHFARTAIHATNITNFRELIKTNPLLSVSFTSQVQNAIPLEGEFIFDLKSTRGGFSAQGNVGSFDAARLNSVSVPMALIRIRTGRINKINFDLQGDDSHAEGDFLMAYENLRLDILRQKGPDQVQKRRGLASLLANMIILDANPVDGNLRKVKAHHNRNPYKSFFNLVWKTLFTGMKSTIER